MGKQGQVKEKSAEIEGKIQPQLTREKCKEWTLKNLQNHGLTLREFANLEMKNYDAVKKRVQRGRLKAKVIKTGKRKGFEYRISTEELSEKGKEGYYADIKQDYQNLDIALCLLLKHYENLEIALLKQIEVKKELINEDMTQFIASEDIGYSIKIIEELEQLSEEKKLQEIIIVAERIEKLFSFIEDFLTL